MYPIDNERLIATFIDLVKIPSPSWEEHAVIEYVADAMKKIGVNCEKHPCGESFNLLARIGGDSARIPILLSCHLDTVVPCHNVRPVINKAAILSDGSTILGGDDKAAVAAFIEAARFLSEQRLPHGPVELLFSCAEEKGLHGIKGFDLSRLSARFGFVFDTGGDIGTIITEAPYHITIDCAITGKAAHAGMEPEKGVSAIRVLAGILNAIPHGRIDHETTVNIGTIAGGTATNIVAREASCSIEARSISRAKLASVKKQIVDIIKTTAKKQGARAAVTVSMEYEGFVIRPDERVLDIARSAVGRIGLTPHCHGSGGGSDTNILNKGGIRSINLSIGMRAVHTTKEYIKIKDLVNGTRLVLSIIESV